MNHEIQAFVIVQRLSPEPLQQLRPIVGGEDILNRVFLPQRNNAFRDGEQEQVVIAKDDLCGRPKLFEITKDAKGVRASIDQIADAPEAVYGRIKPEEFEQSLQGARAALDVADCVNGHRVEKERRWSEGIARRVQIQAGWLLSESASGVLAALRGSPYGGEYDSPLCLLWPCWTAFLNCLPVHDMRGLGPWAVRYAARRS